MTEQLKYKISVDGVQKSKALMNNFSGGVLNVNNSFLKVVATLGSVTAGIAILKKSFDAFIVQRDAVNGINLALKNMLSQGDLTSEALQTIASDLQKVSNYGDLDTMQNVLRPLITTGVNSIAVLNKVTQAIADTAAGTQKSTGEITQMITKIATGSDESFTRFANLSGINIDIVKAKMLGLQTANERVSAATLLLGGKYLGFAKIAINPLTQLQNTIGDFQLELGRAFAPIITNLANMGTLFLSNELNVLKLVSGVKGLMVAFSSLGLVKFGSGLMNQFSIVKGSISDTILAYKNLQKAELLYNTVRSTMNQVNKFSGNTSFESLPAGAKKSIMEYKALINALSKSTAGYAKTASTAFKTAATSMGKFTLSLLGWVGVAYTIFTVIKQLGDSFGWWDKILGKNKDNLKDINSLLITFRTLMEKSADQIKKLAEKKVLTVGLQKLLNDKVKLYNKLYGTSIDMSGKYSLRMSQINSMSDDSVNIANKRLLADKLAYMNRIQQSKLVRNITKEQLKGLEAVLFSIQSQIDDIKLLIELNNIASSGPTRPKFQLLGGLENYYKLKKFEDAKYYNWQLEQNYLAGVELAKMLMLKYNWLLSLAKEQGKKYLQALNDRTKKLKLAYDKSKVIINELNTAYTSSWLDRLNAYTSYINTVNDLGNSSYQQGLINIERLINGLLNLTDKLKLHLMLLLKLKYINNQKASALATYYDSVKYLDESYYEYKLILMQLDLQAQLDNGLISNEQYTTLLKMRTLALQNELLTSSAYYKTFYSIINGMQFTFFQGFKKFNLSLLDSFNNLISQMLSDLLKSGLLSLLSLLIPGGGGFQTFGIISSIADMFSKGFNNQPSIINNNSINTPAIDTSRGSDISMQDLLVGIVDAINENSIKNKIRTIDKVELSQYVLGGNLQRGVL